MTAGVPRVTRWPVLRKALHAVLLDLAGDGQPLAGVEVAIGAPRYDSTQMLYLSGGTINEDFSTMPARNDREETGSLNLWVELARPGDTQAEATDRAFELLDIVGEVLRDPREQPTLWADRMISLGLVPQDVVEAKTDEGCFCGIHALVSYKARI